MSTSFNPSRLALARKRRGFTKKSLASELEVSDRIIAAYEAGERQPKLKSLEKLAELLDFPISFFYGDEIDAIPVEGTSFRSLTKMTARVRDQALAAGELAFSLSDFLDRKFDNFPMPNLPKLQGIDPETAAEMVRKHWGLGEQTIRNVVHLLELHGVRVFSLAEEYREVDAYSCWRKDKPYVFLNTMKTAERSRMDAAHELAHLVLHWHDVIPRKRDVEEEAKLFAAAFLMPKRSVLANVPYGATLNQLKSLKHYWGVSLLALIVRARKLGLLTEWQYRRYCIDVGHTREPEPIKAHETSQILMKALSVLRHEEGITKADVAEQLCITVTELNKLIFGLTLTGVNGNGDKTSDGTEAEKPNLRLV